MTLTQKIRNILEPYWTNDYNITDHSCIAAIEALFKDYGINYATNSYYDYGGGDYEIIYCVFSWVENGKLQTFNLTIEEYYNDYEENKEEEINNVN